MSLVNKYSFLGTTNCHAVTIEASLEWAVMHRTDGPDPTSSTPIISPDFHIPVEGGTMDFGENKKSLRFHFLLFHSHDLHLCGEGNRLSDTDVEFSFKNAAGQLLKPSGEHPGCHSENSVRVKGGVYDTKDDNTTWRLNFSALLQSWYKIVADVEIRAPRFSVIEKKKNRDFGKMKQGP